MSRFEEVKRQTNAAALVSESFTSTTPAGVNQVLVNCPEHDDKTASCSINTVSGLWNCKACGASGDIIDLYCAVRGCDKKTALHDLEARAGISHQATSTTTPRPPAPKKDNKPKRQQKQKTGKVVATFRYFDQEGTLAYCKDRTEPGRDGKKKEFAFYHFTADGSRNSGRGSSLPLLYGLRRLATAAEGSPVFIVEGEGKADALTAWGLIAVCTDSGAAGRWPETFNGLFTSRRVVILPDNDAPGEKYAARAAAALADVAGAVQILRLPGLPEKGDLLDWIAAQNKGAADE